MAQIWSRLDRTVALNPYPGSSLPRPRCPSWPSALSFQEAPAASFLSGSWPLSSPFGFLCLSRRYRCLCQPSSKLTHCGLEAGVKSGLGLAWSGSLLHRLNTVGLYVRMRGFAEKPRFWLFLRSPKPWLAPLGPLKQ